MWKKALLLLSLFAFTVVVTMPADSADARGRSFSSGKRSFSKAPTQSSSVSKSSTTNKSSSSATSGTSTNRGFFSGGSFMKGMMIGGLSGMLFGSMFGGMGAMGNMFGFLINVLALFVLYAVIRGIFDAIKRRRQPQQQDPNDNRPRW
jgi:predicted lipid-binding transport protein (Tim44 family)